MNSEELMETLDRRREYLGISKQKLALLAGKFRNSFFAAVTKGSNPRFNNAQAFAKVLGMEIVVTDSSGVFVTGSGDADWVFNLIENKRKALYASGKRQYGRLRFSKRVWGKPNKYDGLLRVREWPSSGGPAYKDLRELLNDLDMDFKLRGEGVHEEDCNRG